MPELGQVTSQPFIWAPVNTRDLCKCCMHDHEDLDVESPCKTPDIDSDFNPSTQTHTIGDLQAHTQIRVMNTAYIGHETKVSSESVIGDVTHMTNVTVQWQISCL